jgi:hypothetical protein
MTPCPYRTYARARTHARDDGDNGQPVISRHATLLDTTERQTCIDEIKAMLAASGLRSRDMFLTQPLSPSKKDEAAYAQWQDRERHRRAIAHRMSLYGLTAHDLAPARSQGFA